MTAKYKPNPQKDERGDQLAGEEQKGAGLKGWNTPLDIALAGLGLIDPLGVGGMGTRGFGRMSIADTMDVEKKGEA